MNWQYALLFHLIFSTLRGYFDKKLVNNINPWLFFFHLAFWSMIFYSVFFAIQSGNTPSLHTEMILLGIIYAFGFGYYMKAIQISLSRSIVFSSFSIIVSIILSAIFLGEYQFFNIYSLTGQKTILGIFLAFLSLYFLGIAKEKEMIKFDKKWLLYIIIHILFIGFGTYYSKTYLIFHDPLETLISQSIGITIVLLFINTFLFKNIQIKLENYGLIIVDAFVTAFAGYFFFLAIQQGPLSFVLPIEAVTVAISIAFVGLFLFNEYYRISRYQTTGFITGIIGILMLLI